MHDSGPTSFRSLWPLTIFIVVCHTVAFWTFGATFWIDSHLYVQFGHDLADGGIAAAYDGPKYYLIQHLGPGVGWLWTVLSRTLGSGPAWVTFALLQHGVAVAATVALLRACDGVLNTWARWLAAGILALHPFLRAFDNAVMTESLTASALMMMLAVAVEIVRGRAGGASLFLFAAVAALGVQFRATTLLFALSLLGVLAMWTLTRGRLAQRPLVRPGLLTLTTAGMVAIGAYLAFPVARWAALGEFFLPNIDFIALTDALNVNPRPSPEAIQRLVELDLAPDVDPARLARDGIANYQQAAVIAKQTIAYHDDRAAARRLLQRAQRIVRLDSTDALKNQAALSLIGIGITRLDLMLPCDHEVWRGLPVQEYCRRADRWHRWFAWLDRADYTVHLRRFERMLRQPGNVNVDEAALSDLGGAIRPHLSTVAPHWRDPLRLDAVPLEAWLAGMVAGLMVLLRRQPWMALLFAVLPAVQLACMLRIGFSGTRYFHPMLPIYVVSGAFAVQALASWLRRLGPRAVACMNIRP